MIELMEKKIRRDNSSIQISDVAMEAAIRILGHYAVKISKKDLIERLIIWMDQQPDVVQGLVMGTIPPSQRSVAARKMLQQLIEDEALDSEAEILKNRGGKQKGA